MGVETEGVCGALRNEGGTLVTGRRWYALGSWRKLKSLEGMSSMAREGPWWGSGEDASGCGGVRPDSGVGVERGLHCQ